MMKIVISLILSVNLAQAVSLKKLGQKSNALLVLADGENKCGLDEAQISERSQNLKMEIDAKIESLTKKDLQIILGRIGQCEKDCTCDIDALALEKKKMVNEVLNAKAEKTSAADRKVCAARLGNWCRFIQATP